MNAMLHMFALGGELRNYLVYLGKTINCIPHPTDMTAVALPALVGCILNVSLNCCSVFLVAGYSGTAVHCDQPEKFT